jgi:hypothetical protein
MDDGEKRIREAEAKDWDVEKEKWMIIHRKDVYDNEDKDERW